MSEARYTAVLTKTLGHAAEFSTNGSIHFYGFNGEMKASDWLEPVAIDQRTLCSGNSVLRGGHAPRITEPGSTGRTLEIS